MKTFIESRRLCRQCGAWALSGADCCWRHLTDRAAFMDRLRQANDFSGMVLAGVNFSEADWPGADFSGDALFAGSVGGTSNAANQRQELNNIRRTLLTLPGETVVYSGHGPATTIRVEKAHNPFLRD